MIAADRAAAGLLRLGLQAGKAILEVYSRDFSVDAKDDNSPLTEADRASHRTIADGLAKISGGQGAPLPLLSEEGDIPASAVRQTWGEYWLIDPLDGTKEFVKKNGEFTVNIALMRRVTDSGNHSADRRTAGGNWYPALGLVYAPVLDEAFIGWSGPAPEDSGAYRINGLSKAAEGWTGSDDWRRSAEPIAAVRQLPAAGEQLTVVASRSHLTRETEAFIAGLTAMGRTIDTASSGSSLKLCRVAAGEAHAYPRFAPTMEWDTAAADALCRAAGAPVLKADGSGPLEYNKDDLLNPWFLVTGIPAIADLLREQSDKDAQ